MFLAERTVKNWTITKEHKSKVKFSRNFDVSEVLFFIDLFADLHDIYML